MVRDDASPCSSRASGLRACAGVIARPDKRVVSDAANERLVCSLTIRKVFVLTLSFQAKVFL
jgi:hypothetical protein